MDDIDRAIRLAEEALGFCDDRGLLYAAIDLSAAIEKLKKASPSHPCFDELRIELSGTSLLQ